MQTLRDASALLDVARRLGRTSGLGGVLVPTMGALHAGHAALIRRGVELAAELEDPAGCVVSIFVNPTQFNQATDFSRYPRTLEADLDLCRRSGAAAVFVPEEFMMYPPGRPEAAPVPPLPAVADGPGLEDKYRPGHFSGVCQVVLRLLRLLEPRAAVFGEKDWQQLCVVRAMTRSQGLPVRIVAYETLRDPDGLAMSSRNRHLSAEDRATALTLCGALCDASACATPEEAEAVMASRLEDACISTEYAVVRDAETLGPVCRRAIGGGAAPARALIAAWVGSTRLIDNAPWTPRVADISPEHGRASPGHSRGPD